MSGAKAVLELIVFDKSHSRYHRYSFFPLPERASRSQLLICLVLSR